MALHPDVDLKSFSCRAVIDWFELSIRTCRPTQGRWIHERIKCAHGIRVRAVGLDDRTNTTFALRFQEPDLAVVAPALATIDRGYGLDGAPTIIKAEISVDFRPREISNDWQRWLLLGVLVRHLLPSRDVTTTPPDLPRFAWGSGPENVGFFLPQQPKIDVEPYKFMFNGNDRSPYVDATTYFGAKESSPSWRLMDKILDVQNKDRGTMLWLPDDEKRVRVEVTLYENSLREAGVVRLEDLAAGTLTRLQGRHFRWVLPTFEHLEQQPLGRRRSLATYIERQRELKFLTAGVVGLEAMDTQRASKHVSWRRDLLQRGAHVPRLRAGRGRLKDFVAYEDLNGRTAMALEKLTDRVRKQLPAPPTA